MLAVEILSDSPVEFIMVFIEVLDQCFLEIRGILVCFIYHLVVLLTREDIKSIIILDVTGVLFTKILQPYELLFLTLLLLDLLTGVK